MFKKMIVAIVMVTMITTVAFAQQREITGAGASFPLPLYQKMFDEYSRVKDRVNYQSIGSGAGINQLISKTIDFGGTDAIVDPQIEKNAGDTIIHVPTCLGAVVITYNIPGNPKLKLNADIIADIFLGNITNWNDSKIAALNPGVSLPRNLRITVVTRAEASGTTFIFTEYLTKTNKAFAEKIGAGTSVDWGRIAQGQRGNQGVAGLVSQTPGAVGYVELIYAISNNMLFADVRNKAGNFITPNMESVSLAANVNIPQDTKVSLVDTDAPNGYPISSFTWVIIFQEQNYNNRPIEQATATVNLIKWMITDGQAFASALNYAPLPEAAKNAGLELLKKVTFSGKTVAN